MKVRFKFQGLIRYNLKVAIFKIIFKLQISLKFSIIFKRNSQVTLMKAIIVLSCLLFVSAYASLTIGSCQKFSLDGQSCEKCVDHFHLYQGTCYVDILGCSQYTFGNICHSCQNGYILVNNLCCDHNCLAKLFKRHDSTKATKTINENYQTFSKIIPFISEHYIKGAIQNLVQIQYQSYIDVVRYVLLYEFPSGKFKLRRAVVDYVKESKQIIMVDWSNVQNVQEFMNFHKNQIELESDVQANKVIAQAFQEKPIISHIRKFKLTEIDQYEIVINDLENQKIIYQTFYLKNGRTINLLTQSSPLPEFMPTQSKLEGKQIQQQVTINKSLKQVLKQVQDDSRYRPDIHHIVIKQKNRFVKEYIVYIQNTQEEIEYFLYENLKTNSIKIIDFIRKQKETLKPIVNKIIENIDISVWKNITHENQVTKVQPNDKLTPSENKVVELLHNAVTTVKLQKLEEKRLSDCKQVNCGHKNVDTQKIEKEQLSILKLFRQKNPTFTSFELVQTWIHQFKSFNEWTILVKVESQYFFFHVIEFIDSKTFVFWGQTQTKSPQTNSQGFYELINKQENVPDSKVQAARASVTQKYPQTKDYQARKTILRAFPENRNRYIIVLRQKMTQIRYIVLKDATKTWIQQVQTIQAHLQVISQTVETLTEVQHKLQVIVDSVHHGKQIDPEVSLEKVDPIIIKQEKGKQNHKPDDSHIHTDKTEQKHKKIIEKIRENNQKLSNFEIINTWVTKIEGGQRQTLLIKPTKNNSDKVQEEYEYHILVKNATTDEMMYVGHETIDAIVENQQGQAVEPPSIIKLVQKKIQKPEKTKPQTIIEQIKVEIIESVQKAKDVQQVTKKIPSKIEQEVYKHKPQLSQWHLQKVWRNKEFKTYVQHSALFSKSGSYVYIYLFEWIQNETFSYVGSQEIEKPHQTDEGEFVTPTPQHKFENSDTTFLTSAVVQKFPQVAENQVISVVQRVFPQVKRYTLILRTSTKKLQYVLHIRTSDSVIVEWQTLQQNLPKLTKEEKIIKQIVTNTIKNVENDKQEQKRISDSDNKTQTTHEIEGEHKLLLKLFRQKNPSSHSFQLVQTWTHKFKTFVEWTILIKVTENKQVSFIYFHAIQFLEKKQFAFWGQKTTLEPALDENQKYVIGNPQQHVPQSKVQAARSIINTRFPEVTSLPARKIIVRQYPNKRSRVVIIIRHQKSKVQYVVMDDSTNSWLQQSQTIQENLEAQDPSKTELKQKLQVVASQLSENKPIDKQVNMQKSTTEIEIAPKPAPIPEQKQKPTAPQQHVDEQFKKIQVTHSAVAGQKTQNTRSLSEKDKKVVKKVIKYIITLTSKFTTFEVETINNIQPLVVIQQQFCDVSDIMLIFEVQHHIYAFAFRLSINNEDNVQYLGKFNFTRQAGMSDQAVIQKSTALRADFSQESAIQSIVNKHKNLSGLTAKSVEVKQFGDFVRAAFVYKQENYSHRYIVSKPINEDYSIMQQCRLQQTKQTHTETKVTVTGETSLSTNDVQNIIKQDQTAKQVIENVKREVEEVKNSEVTNVKVTDYDKKTQYVVSFETHDPQAVLTQHEVSVVHDKTKHNNDIVAVQVTKPHQAKPVEQAPTLVSKQNPTTTTTESQPTPQVAVPVVPTPITSENTYNIVKQEPTNTQSTNTTAPTTTTSPLNPEIVKQITKQIEVSENVQQKDIEVKQTLVQAHTEDKIVNKVQQVVQNHVSGQKILVTSIVNTQTNKVIVEDIKPIDEHIAKHLEPVSQPAPSKPQVIKQEQPVIIKPQEVQNVLVAVQKQIEQREIDAEECQEIAKQIELKQAAQAHQLETPKPKEEEKPAAPIVINPTDIQTILEHVKDQISVVDNTAKVEVFSPPVTQSKEQVLNYLQTVKPQTSTAKVVSTTTQTLPTSVVTQVIQQTPINTIYATVQKTENGTSLTDFVTIKNTNQNTIQTVVAEVEKQDTAGYQPIDPHITNIGTATQIIQTKPVNQFEQKIDISKPDQKVEQVVEAIRNEYPITSTAPVISATETKVSPTTSQIKVDFYVSNENNAYKVDEAKVQVSTTNNQQTYAVASFTEVVNNGVQTNVVLDKTDPTELPNIVNAAYGFEKIDLTSAAKNADIQAIQAEIQRRYSDFVAGQSVVEIQSLELKSGKVNYIFRYKSVYFTIYWDALLKRIIFLNEVSTVSRTEFEPVKNTDYFTNGLAYIARIHQAQMKNYKALTSGEHLNGTNIVFSVQFLSGNKKYRSIFQVNKETMDTIQLLFTQVIELTMKDNSLRQIKLISDIYQKIDSSKYKSNRYFTMVDQYAKNRNQMLIGAKILGASFKPQNLGFNFKIFYKTEDSRLISAEIYIETFSQKYSQISINLLDFENGFSTAEVPKIDMDKIVQLIASKSSLILTAGQYSITTVEAKQFFYGYLFKLIIAINNVQYEGLAYVDSVSGQISLISWRVRISGTGCETTSQDGLQCKKCSTGFINSVDMKTCIRQIDGCQVYGDTKQTCNVCKTGFEKLNNICTKDCGVLCAAFAFP